MTENTGEKYASARPVMTSVIASALPLVGTLRNSMPAASRKRSRFMCVELPMPALLATSWPGFAFAAAKAKPGQLVASNAGIGSSTHMNLERFRLAAGIEFLSVPTKGNAEAITEVITGRADAYFSPVFSVIAHVKEGRVQALAVGSPKRTPLFPDLPTTVEAGYPNSDYNFWIGALVASKTPRETVQRLHREFNAALAQPDVQDRMKKLGVDPLT